MSDETEVLDISVGGEVKFHKANDLKKIIKTIDNNLEDALKVITGIMSNDKNDPKLRFTAASYLVDTLIEIKDSVRKDEFARTVAQANYEMKRDALKRLPQGLKVIPNETGDEGGEDSGRPIYKPDMIVDVSHVSNLN